MRPEAVFVAGYATALLAGAVALHRLGRAQRSLAHRSGDRRHRDGTETTTDDRDSGWPHSEVRRFYSGMALVAASASTLLSAGELLARDHRTFETALLIIVFVLAVLTVGWLRAKIHQRPEIEARTIIEVVRVLETGNGIEVLVPGWSDERVSISFNRLPAVIRRELREGPVEGRLYTAMANLGAVRSSELDLDDFDILRES